jgi:Domain of unknown function (DUF4395)
MESVGASCPVNGVRVDEHVVRLIAAQVIVLGVAAWWFEQPFITLFLLIDFGFRAFDAARFSLLRQLAFGLTVLFKLNPKPTDAAPKQFAALLGLVVIASLLLAQLIDLPLIALIVVGLLVIFATLESVFSFCVGCVIYQLLPRKQ